MAKNKTLKVLSTGSVAGMIAAAVLSSQAFAAVDAYSVKIGEDVLKYDKAALTESFLASKAGDAAPLYEDFTANFTKAGGFYAFHDAKAGKYISVADITAKYLEAKAAGEAFVVDTYTESADAKVLEVPTVKKVVVKDGKVVVEAEGQVTTDLKVESVSAINATTIQVTLDKDTDATKATDKDGYKVSVGGNNVTVTGVTYSAANNKATLTVSLTGLNGKVVVNGVESTTSVDYTKPVLTNVEALNNKTIVVTFSEPVADSALTAGTIAGLDTKYSLYNKVTGVETKLTSLGTESASGIVVTAAFANADRTQVKLNITGTTVAGYPQGGLSNSNYILYVKNINDRATVANTIIPSSPFEFTGTLTPDTAAPRLVSSAFNIASGQVTLNYDKAVLENLPSDSKIKVKVGASEVALLAADYNAGTFATGTSVTSVIFELSAAGLAKVNALGANPTLVLAEGAFSNGTLTTAAVETIPTTTTGPVLLAVTYDELTNKAVFRFNKTIDVSEITTFAGAKFVIGGVDIQDANLKLNTTADSTELDFTVSAAKAQTIEAASRNNTKVTATVAAGTVKDTETTPNSNVALSSSVDVVIGAGYVKDATAPTFTTAKYNADSNVLELGFSEALRADISDYTLASIEIYKDDNGTAGIQTTGTTPDTKLGTLADYDASGAGTNGLLQSDFLKSDKTAAASTDEMGTLYINTNTGAVTLHSVLNAVPALTDVYVVVKKDAVKDPSANKIAADTTIKMTKVAVSNTGAITAATTLVTTNRGQVVVQFKNASGVVAVDPATATVASNYNLYLKSNPLNKITVEAVSMNATNTEATLFLSTPMTASGSADYALTTANILTTSAKAANIDGTVITALNITPGAGADTTTLSATQALALTDKDASGTVNAGDLIEITFNEAIKLPTGFTVADLTVSNNHTLGNSTYVLSADKTKLTITVGSSATIAVNDTITFPVTVKDYEGNALASGAGQVSNAMAVSGDTAPVIKSAVYRDANNDGEVGIGDTLVLTFDQKLGEDVANPINGLAAGDFITTANASLGAFTAAKTGDREITLTFTTAPDFNAAVGAQTFAVLGTDTIQIDYANGAAVPEIRSVWGTSIASAARTITTADVDVVAADVTAPKLTAISYKTSTNELTFTFDEAVNASKATTANALAAALLGRLNITSGSLGSTATAATLSNDKKSVTITLDGTEGIDNFSTISVQAGGFGDATDAIVDASGNVAVRAQGTAYAVQITN